MEGLNVMVANVLDHICFALKNWALVDQTRLYTIQTRPSFTGQAHSQRLKLGSQNQLLVSSKGSKTSFYGNDLGW
ncbi:unnamed protein product [Ilex paraguariensis]|uniref:Uncharacterized protein n=1 Tax=Ilex paraguariensis TaxID=185542 RepID=A0ABC8RQZ5_9AQUA